LSKACYASTDDDDDDDDDDDNDNDNDNDDAKTTHAGVRGEMGSLFGVDAFVD